jgi:SHS2 domain-containing protein
LFRWVEHTAEVELEIEARSERQVLVDALEALGELLSRDPGDAPPRWERATRNVVVSAEDRPALLAAWLEELVYLAESEGFVATGVRRLELTQRELTATITGVLDDPPPLVKAVTYHRLLFEPSGGGYLARVVLDV